MNPRSAGLLPRTLAVILACASVGVALLILVVPAYSTEGVTSSSSGVTTLVTGSRTVFDANPQARAALIAIIGLGFLIGLFGLLSAWGRWTPARWVLAGLLVPLTVVAILSLPSIGLFLVPVAAMGWTIVGRSTSDPRQQ